MKVADCRLIDQAHLDLLVSNESVMEGVITTDGDLKKKILVGGGSLFSWAALIRDELHFFLENLSSLSGWGNITPKGIPAFKFGLDRIRNIYVP